MAEAFSLKIWWRDNKWRAITSIVCATSTAALLNYLHTDSALEVVRGIAALPFKIIALIIEAIKPEWGQALTQFIFGRGFLYLATVTLTPAWFTLLKLPQLLLRLLFPPYPSFLDPTLESPDEKNAIKARAPNQAFVGRADETAVLISFAKAGDAGFRWMTLAGRMGNGKTRLALEVMKSLRAANWDVGFIKPNALETGLVGHRFRRDTFLVVDEHERTRDLWLTEQDMPSVIPLLSGRKCKHRVRLLVIGHGVHVPPPGADANGVKTGVGALLLNGLSPIDAVALNGGRQTRERRPLLIKLGDNPWHELASRARQRLDMAGNDDARRLLALASLAGPMPMPTSTDLQSLSALFEGAPKSLLQSTLPSLEPELLAGEVLLQWAHNAGDLALENLMKEASASNAAAAQSMLAGLWRERPEPKLVRDGSALSSHQSSQFAALERLSRYRPLNWYEWAVQEADGFVRACSSEVYPLKTIYEIDVKLRDIEALVQSWPSQPDTRLQIKLADQWRNATVPFGNAAEAQAARGEVPDWTRLDGALARLNDLMALQPDCLDIHIITSNALFISATSFARAAKSLAEREPTQYWTRVDRVLKNLDGIIDVFPDNPEISVWSIEAWVNATILFSEMVSQRATSVTENNLKWLQQALDRLDRTYPTAPWFRHQAARGWTAAAFVDQSLFLKGAIDRLKALNDYSVSEKQTPTELAGELAHDWRNIVSILGDMIECNKKGDIQWVLKSLETAFDCIKNLCSVYGEIEGVKRGTAEAYLNAISTYASMIRSDSARGRAIDWVPLDRILLEFYEVIIVHRDDTADVVVPVAMSFVNATSAHAAAAVELAKLGEQQDWCRLDDAFKRLEAVMAMHSGSPKVAVEAIQVATNVLLAEPPKPMRERAFALLKEVGWQFPTDGEIQAFIQGRYPLLTHIAQKRERMQEAQTGRLRDKALSQLSGTPWGKK